MTDATEERMIDKVQKLLAKAEGTDNKDEADAFFAKAEEIMITHALNEDVIRARMGETKSITIGMLRIPIVGIFRSAELIALYRIAEAFRFKGIKTANAKFEGKSADILSVIGPEDELRDFEILVASLRVQLARELRRFHEAYKIDHWFADKQELYVARRSFIDGYGTQVANRIKATQQAVIKEVSKTDDLLPILADKATLIDMFIKNEFGKLRQGRASRKQFSPTGHAAGKRAGEKADVGQQRFAGRRAIGA